MYTNHRHYILLVFAVGALATTIGGYVFMREHIISSAIEASRITKESALITEKEKHTKKVTNTYTKLSNERVKLDEFIVKEEGIVNLIEQFEKVGIDTGSSIELSSILNDEFVEVRGISFSHFKAHIEGKGSWPSLMRALTLIENMPQSVSISNMRLFESGDEISTKEPTKARMWRLSFDVKVLTTK